MQYTTEPNNGASRTAKTIALYSAIIIAFGAILGFFYIWAGRSIIEEEFIPDAPLTEQQQLEKLASDLEAREDTSMTFATDEELWTYINENMPPDEPRVPIEGQTEDEEELAQ